MNKTSLVKGADPPHLSTIAAYALSGTGDWEIRLSPKRDSVRSRQRRTEEAVVNLYSCLVIGAGNLLVTRQEFEAATDQDAMARARELFRDAPIAPHKAERFEVWGETRRISA